MNLANEGVDSTNPDDADKNERELLFVGFNQDHGCFACGMSNGFVIYNVDPFRETFRRIFPYGGIGIVEMLFRCNLLAIVGGGRNPRYPTNKVMIWDDHQSKCIGELKFRTPVYAVRLRRDRVVVVLEAKVFVYRFKDLKLLDQLITFPNPKGLVSLCPENKSNVLAVPGLTRGSIRVELYDISKATLIKAHETDLAQFSLNADGSRLASASEKGTLIRIWNCHTGDQIRELRRGMDRAEIYCLSFNFTSTFIACSSDKGTIHIFSLLTGAVSGTSEASSTMPPPPPTATGQEEQSRTQSVDNKLMAGFGLNVLKGILPTSMVPKYFESEWSFAQVRGIEGKSICAFSRDSSKIVVVCANGTFIVSSLEEGGDCPRLATSKFLKASQGLDSEHQEQLSSESGTAANGTRVSNELNS